MIPKRLLLETDNSLPNDLSVVEYVTERGIPIGYVDNYSNFVEFMAESPTTEELQRHYDRVKKTLAITSKIQPTLIIVSVVFIILSYIYRRRDPTRQP